MLVAYVPRKEDNYFEADKEGVCVVCGKPTNRVEMNYEAYICSDECEQEFIRPLKGKSSMNKDNRALEIIENYMYDHFDPTDETPHFSLFIVWKAKILKNWKYLISSTIPDGKYYELTFNGDNNEWYLDVYVKLENKVIPDEV